MYMGYHRQHIRFPELEKDCKRNGITGYRWKNLRFKEKLEQSGFFLDKNNPCTGLRGEVSAVSM